MSNNENNREEIKEKNIDLKLEINETYHGLVRLTNQLQKKIEKLLDFDKQIEKQHENSLTKKESLQNTLNMSRKIAHELAQPLSVIVGRCELLSMSNDLSPEAKKNINQILVSANKLSQAVGRMQSINKSFIKQLNEDVSKISGIHNENPIDLNSGIDLFNA